MLFFLFFVSCWFGSSGAKHRKIPSPMNEHEVSNRDFETRTIAPDPIESKVGDWYTRWQNFQQEKRRNASHDELSSPISTLGSETLDIIYDSLQWVMSLLDSISAFRNAFGLNAIWRAFRKRLHWFTSRAADSHATQQIRSLYDVITTQIIDPLQTLFVKYFDRIHGDAYIATEDLFVTRLYRWIRRAWDASILGSWWQRRQQMNLIFSKGTANYSSFSIKALLVMVLIYVWRIGYLRWRMNSSDGSLSPMTHYGQMFTEEMPLEEYKNYKRRFYQHRSQQNSDYSAYSSGYADSNINQRRDFFSYWPSRQQRRQHLEFRALPPNRDGSYHHQGSFRANQDTLVGIRRRTHQDLHHSNPDMQHYQRIDSY